MGGWLSEGVQRLQASSQDDNSGQLALKALHPIVHQTVKVSPERYVGEVACSCFFIFGCIGGWN